MVLPKYFLLTARKTLILPKSWKLGGAIAPPAPPAGTGMTIQPLIQEPNAQKIVPELRTLAFDICVHVINAIATV